MAKIDVTKHLLDLDGEPIAAEATLRKIAVEALWNPLAGDEKSSAEDKIKLDRMARLIHKNDVVDLQAEDIALIKRRINAAYQAPGVVAGAFKLLDPQEDEAQPEA